MMTIHQAALQEEGLENDAVLDNTIKKLELDLKKARKKDADGDEVEVVTSPSVLLDVI